MQIQKQRIFFYYLDRNMGVVGWILDLKLLRMIQILMWAKWAGTSSEWAALGLVFWQFSKRTKKSRLWSAAFFNHSGIPSTFEQNWSLEKNASWYKIGLWCIMKQLIYLISNKFIRCFHQFFQRIFLSLSSWKRKQISYWS